MFTLRAFVSEKATGACSYLCYLFCSSSVCLVPVERRGLGHAGRTGAGSFFYPSSGCLRQGKLCHQLSACQRLVLLFQSTGQLTFLLSLVHFPQNTSGERGKKSRRREEDAPHTRLLGPFHLPPSFSLADSFSSSFPLFVLQWLRHTMRMKKPLFYLVLQVICLIKHWCSFNKTEPSRLLNIDAPS